MRAAVQAARHRQRNPNRGGCNQNAAYDPPAPHQSAPLHTHTHSLTQIHGTHTHAQTHKPSIKQTAKKGGRTEGLRGRLDRVEDDEAAAEGLATRAATEHRRRHRTCTHKRGREHTNSAKVRARRGRARSAPEVLNSSSSSSSVVVNGSCGGGGHTHSPPADVVSGGVPHAQQGRWGTQPPPQPRKHTESHQHSR